MIYAFTVYVSEITDGDYKVTLDINPALEDKRDVIAKLARDIASLVEEADPAEEWDGPEEDL